MGIAAETTDALRSMTRMTRTRPALALLAAVAGAGALAVPAHAATLTIGSDLSSPATVALSDPNDIAFWPSTGSANGVEVPAGVQGEAIAFRLKGGTVQTAEQRDSAEKADPMYDLFHFQVLRPHGDGTFRATVTSDDYVAPIIGIDATERSVKEWTAGNSRMCVRPGDRISLSEVGGYTPYIFGNGLPYQVFAGAPGAVTNEFRAGGMISEGATEIKPTPVVGTELLLQVVIGTGADARYTCQTEAEQHAGSGGGSGGSPTPRLKAERAIPSLKTVRLDKKGRVPVKLTCRPDGADCAGRIELRAHKKRIGSANYALRRGASGVFVVKLTKAGRHFVKVASSGKLRTAVTAKPTAQGGGTGRGLFNIKPAKTHKKHKK